ncbi:glycoside hydrolase family 18 protein [Mangrovibacterium marinum]|uniref:glycoside hydrolase family 18 protein n=1 Tax=Mangrovibacterium marinum TaxID=1639118 RepID=UPI002A188525|nr:glycoside hydrolase family 18 protein [Mangrovibacterium marinum]
MRVSIFILLISVLVACSPKTETPAPANKEYKIVGYVAGYENFDPAQVDANKLTHINYAFANINMKNGGVQFELDTDSLKIAKLMALKQTNPNLKVLYSVGGWVWSDQFSHVAAFEASRKTFAAACVQLMKKHGFDGVDLDWEYPGQRAEDNAFRLSDKGNFTLLLAEIRRALDEQGKQDNTHYLLTIATGADQAYIDHTELGKAQEYLDFINVMCYDYYHGWHYQTGHHANLFPSDEEKFGGNSGLEAIERHLKAGVPAEKLVMGIPFYGREWEKVNPENGGLYQPAMATGMIVAYRDIVEKLQSGKYEKRYDESAKASYLWNAEDSIFISWETPADVAQKVAFIKEKGLGGAMFWEYSLDHNQELLNSINEEFGK